MDTHADECRWCRGAAVAASRLRFQRLGKHERRVLLQAPPPSASPHWIVPPGPSQAAQTATRRAVARLVELKLILVPPQTMRLNPGDGPDTERLLSALRRKYMVVRCAIRTTLGQHVVEFYAPELEDGGRIRWIDHLDELTEATQGNCPLR